MSFGDSISDLNSTSVTPTLYRISCYIGQRYNSIRLCVALGWLFTWCWLQNRFMSTSRSFFSRWDYRLIACRWGVVCHNDSNNQQPPVIFQIIPTYSTGWIVQQDWQTSVTWVDRWMNNECLFLVRSCNFLLIFSPLCSRIRKVCFIRLASMQFSYHHNQFWAIFFISAK